MCYLQLKMFYFIAKAPVMEVYKILTRKPVNRFCNYLNNISLVRTSVHIRYATKYNNM